eukprot:Phypoly_transcript_11053.p1 GENE.Phypoly_transcript_11053~~Phypoly_transcript_11053.p1  ORF type:complete len:400 (+),score=62.95 Phypoly_transcript_11053:56-1201(+)
MAGKKKNNNHNKSGGGKQSKKAEREMRTFHRRKRDRIKYGCEKWNADFKKLSDQLVLLGLTIKDVAGDGNCLFRAIGDQMENNPNKHHEYRATIVTFMEKNRDMFEPFLDAEDDGTFEEYILSMRTDGAWGGNLEIQAASLSLHINIIIYQLDQPRWEVVNFADAKTRTIQLSYLDGDHYASVRPIAGVAVPPPQATTIPTHIATNTPKKVDDYVQPPNDFEKLVMDNSGNHDLTFVRQTLEEHEWDADATIAYLLQLAATTTTDTNSVTGADLEGDQQVPTDDLSEGRVHKHLKSIWSFFENYLLFVYLLVFSTFSKISEHIHNHHIPHHPHLHHRGQGGQGGGKGGKGGKKKNRGRNNVAENPAPAQVAPIVEMSALSI